MARKLFPIMFVLWAALLALAFFTALFAAEKAIGEAVERATRQAAAARQCVMDAIATLPAAYPLDKIEYHCHQQARNTP